MSYGAIARVRRQPSRRFDPYTYDTEHHPKGMAVDRAWASLLFDADIAQLTDIMQTERRWVKPLCEDCHAHEIQVKGKCKRCYDVRFIREQRERERAQRPD